MSYGIQVNGININTRNTLGIKEEISIADEKSYSLNSNGDLFNILFSYDAEQYRNFHNQYNMNNHNIDITGNSVEIAWKHNVPNYPVKPVIYVRWG